MDWCWRLEPRIEPDGVVHHTVMADSTWMNGWCLLTAVDGQSGEVLAWQWCNRESTATYQALFAQLAPPDVLVCDGMKGILKACAQTWPNTRVQRCLIHVQRDTKAHLTSKPRPQAGRELKKLADMPARIHDADTAAGWGGAPDAWHERWKRMLAERTYAKDHPDDPKAATSRSGWWRPHLPLRRACEWLCYMKSSQPDPTRFLKEHERHTVHGPSQEHEPDTSQPTLGTGIDWNEFHTNIRHGI